MLCVGIDTSDNCATLVDKLGSGAYIEGMKNEANAVKFLGTTDDVTACDCCGRSDLKSTVALSFNDGEAVYFGVVCAARALGTDSRTVKSETRKADDARAKAEAAARQAAHEAVVAPWFAFLAANGSGNNTFSQIESLGGYKAARELYLSR